MPRISFFHGISIWMYWNEGAHARPHFHARYSGQAASEWAVLHQDELRANWERARREEPLEPIDPLP